MELPYLWNYPRIAELIREHEKTLTARALRLFRLSCIWQFLSELGDQSCEAAVRATELATEGIIEVQQQRDAVERMVPEAAARLDKENEEVGWVCQNMFEQFVNASDEPVDEAVAAQIWETINQTAQGRGRQQAMALLDYRFQTICSLPNLLQFMSYWEVENEVDHLQRHFFLIVNCLVGFRYTYAPLPLGDSRRHEAFKAVGVAESEFETYCRYEAQRMEICFRAIIRPTDLNFNEIARLATTKVLKLAGEIDISRNFLRLEELGLELNTDIADSRVLLHCTRNDPTIRGSWLIDALLGKQ